MFETMFTKLFAGVPTDTFDTVPLLPLGRWLLPIGIFLLAAGYDAEKNSKIELMAEYRYETISRWWKNRYWRALFSGIPKAVLLLLLVFICDFVFGKASLLFTKESLKISAVWISHSMSLMAFFLLLDVIFDKRAVPAALFLFEGITFLLGYRIKAVSHAMYGIWGMYTQSD